MIGIIARKKFIRWTIFGLLIIGMVILSGIMGKIISPHLRGWETLGYLGIFLGAAFANATIIFPIPFFGFLGPLAIGLAQQNGTIWGYVEVASLYAVGATLGESVSYYVGWTGRKILGNGISVKNGKKKKISIVSSIQEGINEDIQNLGLEKRMERWLKGHGGITIFVLALQPILPFDVAGIIAGSLKYPFWKFFLFCFLGRVPKYLVLITGFDFWKLV